MKSSKKYEYGQLPSKEYFCVIDLEMLCWEDSELKPRSAMEIIEIGIVVCDKNFNIISEISEFVKPYNDEELSDYCKTLTGITQEEVNSARNLILVMKDILDKELPPVEKFVWCAWGNDPLWLQKELESKTYLEKNKFKFDTRYINLKVVDGKRRGLKKALRAAGIEQVLPAHRALSDAKSTAFLAKQMKVTFEDCLVSNERTFRQRKTQEQKDLVVKLVKRHNISEKVAEKCLKLTSWDFSKCTEFIKTLKSELKRESKD